MNAPDYLHMTTAEDAIASLELACVFLKTANAAENRQRMTAALRRLNQSMACSLGTTQTWKS
jgi:hypothetical protein